jgi:hypothetical protein
MRRSLALSLAVLLLPALALAQGAGTGTRGSFVSRGNFLKPGQYATQAPLALFVDGASGNDANDCSGTGASACQTIQAAVNLIPQVVNHPVTVDIAAGSYAGFRLMNHNFAPTDVTAGAYINVRGAAQANFTPATGTATGTVTAVATDAIGFHIITDGAQTWTASNLSTRFLSLTGGTGSGQVCPIISNTATSVTVSCTFSPAPVAGTTYAVTTPATLITSAVNNTGSSGTAAGSSAGIILSELTAPRFVSDMVNIQDVEVSGAFSGLTAMEAIGWQVVRNRFDLSAAAGVTGIALQGTSQGSVSASVVSSSTRVALEIGATGTGTSSQGTSTRVINSFLTSSTTGVQGTIQALGPVSWLDLVTSEIVDSSTTVGGPLSFFGGGAGSVKVRGSRLRCGAAGSAGIAGNAGVRVHVVQQASTFASAGPGLKSIGFTNANSIETCGNGVLVWGSGQQVILTGDNTLLSNTVGANAIGGGKVVFTSTVPTFTTNTTDISVDGTTSTSAAFVTLVPNSIVNLNYLSAVYLQP